MTDLEFDLGDVKVNPVDDLLTGILINYQVIPNVTYAIASNYECKLDLWLPLNMEEAVPTLIYIHG